MSSVISIDQMIALEEQAFAEGVDAWELMQQAGRQMAQAIVRRFPDPGICWVFAGKGNNGGDAWVAARYLQELDWEVEIRAEFPDEECSALSRRAKAEWREGIRHFPHSPKVSRRAFLVLDGLLGIGRQGEPRDPIGSWIQEINALRERGAVVFSLDLPSGLGSAQAVVADHTLTVGFAKIELLADDATHFVGRLTVLPLPELTKRIPPKTDGTVATAKSLRELLPPRSFDIHKGQCGRVMLVVGSRGTTGAAVLAAHGALRGGAGLVSLICPPDVYPQLAPMLPPEIMALPWGDQASKVMEKMDILAIGPGLDPDWQTEIWDIMETARVPMVLDAGALTIVAADLDRFRKLKVPLLLTPHPGEMERLFPQEKRTRAAWATDFLAEFAGVDLTLLLKGSRTIVARRGESLSYNTTGHPGMATGGMGDTLTGVCGALLGQKLSTYDAARIGAWVCGRAAEIAIEQDAESQESLLPSDLHRTLGRAFTDLRLGMD